MTSTRKMHADRSWSVILAGGEGERTRPFIENWLGYHKPKQYCAFVGRRSLFQHTVDRADRMASPERRVVVVAESHRDEVRDQLHERVAGTIVHQPRNRGTAPGVFLALAYVRARDPDAIVTIFPSDHFVYPEERLADAVTDARKIAAPTEKSLVLLGARPTGPETEYGWIEPGFVSDGVGRSPAREVLGFVEKPCENEAQQAFSRGALWNTLIVTGRVGAFWKLGWKLLPEMMCLFETLTAVIGSADEHAQLETTYRHMPGRDFSADILQHCREALVVLELSDVTWSDWGRPERIRDTLRAIGKQPAIPVEGEDGATASAVGLESFSAAMIP